MNRPAGKLRHIVYILAWVFCGANLSAAVTAPLKKVPIIYCTDLFHPHDDPDDHFDLATLYAIPELDIRAIILDQGEKQEQKPGSVPLRQLNSITGRKVPWAIGLAKPLQSPTDTGTQQELKYQKAVEKILQVLSKSAQTVDIITTGSLRDVAAAYNRQPELFRAKAGKLLIFIGEASSIQHPAYEYNVNLDKNAFIRIMNSGLDIYWVPCFDGGIWQNHGRASFFRAPHRVLLGNVSDKLMNYFIYALLVKKSDYPVRFLNRKVDNKDRAQVLSQTRNLWCTAIFTYLARRKYIRRNDKYISLPADCPCSANALVKPFHFTKVTIFADKDGRIHYRKTGPAHTVHQFQVLNQKLYPEIMTSITADLLGRLSKP